MIGDNLHIVVCVKQTPAATAALSFDATTGLPTAAQFALNPFDEIALEEGVRIKERLGGKAQVTALCLGAATAVDSLRDAIARGADGAAQVVSADLAGGDTFATATALAAAIGKLSKERGPVDLILFGKQTNDSETGSVGPQTAALLDYPSISFVRKVSETGGGKITVERASEDGAEVIEMDLPAAIAVVKEIAEPRIASLKGKMASKKAEIPTWDLAAIGLDAAKAGKKGSLVAHGVPQPPPKRGGGIVVEGATSQEKVQNLLAKLKERKLIYKMADNKDVWCVAEVRQGKVAPATFELLSKGRQMADALGQKLVVVLIGKGVESLAAGLGSYGADVARVADHAAFENFTDEAYGKALSELAKQHSPRLILLAGTNSGRAMGARAAALIPAGLAAEITELEYDKGSDAFKAQRNCGGGVFIAPISWNAKPEMATVRAGSFPRAQSANGKTAEVVKETLDPSGWKLRTRFKSFTAEESKDIDLGRADVIVSGGYALGGPEPFKQLREIAQLLGGAVGASRRAVDSGWIPYRHQVGLTGRTVRPKLYIAIGISGQIQHLAGMSQSGTVVCINKDPKAPLMEMADFRVEGDIFEIIPAMIDELKKLKH